MARVAWMWGDASIGWFSIVGHGLAKMNPLRWSRMKSTQEVVQELEVYEVQGVQRSVLIHLTISGEVETRRYSLVSDAIADLNKMIQVQSLIECLTCATLDAVTECLSGVPPEDFKKLEKGEGVQSLLKCLKIASLDAVVLCLSDVPPEELKKLEKDAGPAAHISPAVGDAAQPLMSSGRAEVEGDQWGWSLPPSCLSPASNEQHTQISADDIMQLLLAGGRDALLGQWMQQEQALMSLRSDLSVPRGTAETPCEENILEACKGLHRALADIVADDELEPILGCEARLQSAPLVLHFLVDQASKTEGGLRETLAKDLAVLLRIPGWRESFESEEMLGSLPDDCRYILASAGIALGRASFVRGGSESEQSSAGSIHDDEIKRLVQDALHHATASLVDAGARIVILGDRGAGKSSICNAAFGDAVAAAGPGRPVTTSISLYEATDACPVHIYDTKGFETLCDNGDALAQLRELVEERREAVSRYAPDDPAAVKEQLHAIWWVVDVVGGGRFNPKSVESVARIFSDTGVPIIMVLNKCDVEESYVRQVEQSVKEHCLWASSVVRVVAHPRLGPISQLCEECGSSDIEINCKRMSYSCDTCDRRRVPFKNNYGFDDLIKVTIQCLPKIVSASFVSAQKVWLEGLDKVALRDICVFGAAAGGLGASPLPFLTHFALFPLQMALVIRLASIYGVIISWKTALHLVCSLGVVSSVGFVGWTAATALKMVPGLNIVGMASDACISAGFTIAIGLVVRTMLRRVRGKAAGFAEVQPEELAELMSIEERRSLFTQYFNRLRAPLIELMEDASSVSMEALENVIVAASQSAPLVPLEMY